MGCGTMGHETVGYGTQDTGLWEYRNIQTSKQSNKRTTKQENKKVLIKTRLFRVVLRSSIRR